jgi:predicted  nucleic acid-binding Zn-ribbon protein
MAYQVHANPEKLDAFNEEIQKTPAMLENVFGENNEIATKALQHIDMISDMYNKKRTDAQIDLDNAKARLATAERANAANDEKADLSFFEERVYNAHERLIKIMDTCKRVNDIRNDYEVEVNRHKWNVNDCFNDYCTILKKGSGIIAKYAAFVRASVNAIKG